MAIKDKYASIVTPVCPSLFPTLQDPQVYVPPGSAAEEGDRGKYSCTLILDPENPDHADFIGKIRDREELLFADEEERASGKIKKGEFFSCLQPEEDKEGNETGGLKLKASMRAGGIIKSGPRKGQSWERDVVVLDHSGRKFEWKEDGEQLGNGSLIRLETMPFAMTKEKRTRVFMTLVSAQVVRPEWFSPGGSSAFAGQSVDPEAFEGAGPVDADASGEF